MALCITVQAQITSTFDTDADGWTFYNASFASITVTHNPVNGNPGGYISATYASTTGTSNVNGNNQAWLAPAKFLGNHLVKSLGMNLKFDLQQSQAGTTSGYDVRIASGGNFIYFQLPVKPAVAPAWSSYSLPLDETIAWRYGSGTTIATRSQIIGILTNVTSITIRGTYATNAAYTSGLDNVILEQRTLPIAPAITSFIPTSGTPGTSITINGNNFDPTASNNTVYFGAIAGTITSASATSLSVTVPVGAQYGNISILNKITGLKKQSQQPFKPTFSGGGRIIPASFNPKVDINLSIGLQGLSMTDIDGDGWLDLAVASSTASKVIEIYRNLGLGGDITLSSFAAKVTVAIPGTSTNYTGLQFVDLDGDGKLDAVTSNVLVIFGSAYFITYRNISTPGNIAFEAPEYWAGLTDDSSPNLVADIDGDGRPELIGGEGSFSTGALFWMAQNISNPGNIEFGASVSYFTTGSNGGFAGATVGDLDNDGKPEMLVTYGDRFSIFKNNSTPGIISLTDIGIITHFQYVSALQVADFNLDGKNDLVWKRSGNAEFYIRLNTNSGGSLATTDFSTEVILSGDLGAYGGMSIADINGDNKPDIVASDNADVGVFENVYTGGVFDATAFVPAYQYQGSGAYPTSPVIGDLNGDTKLDILVGVTGSSPNKIAIFENKNIHAPVISLNTVSPLKGVVGSTVTITGNNFSTIPSDNIVWFGAVKATVLTAAENLLTVAVPAGATYAPVSVTKSGLTSRYHLPFQTTFGSGVTFDNTHFAPPVSYTLTGAGYNIEAGDLNIDGRVDILASAGNTAYAFRNDYTIGSITTTTLVANDTLSPTTDVFGNPRLEDFDGDGYLDVASINTRIRRNITTGSNINFTPNITFAGAGNLAYADFNQDGKIDMAIANSGANQLFLVENRTLPGTFVPSGTFSSFSTTFAFTKPGVGGDVVAADFDADGFPDVITVNLTTDNISIFRNLGGERITATQFAARVDVAVGDNPNRIYKGDFDGDGKLDLMLYHWTGTSTTLLVVLQNMSTVGNISFSRIDLTNPSAATVAHVADLDGDGKPEIITTSESGNRFSIFKNIHTTGALTAASFAAPFNTTVTAPRGITTGDLNLDGKPEIILTRAAGLLLVYENLIPSIPPPTIISFTPTSGPVGMVVTITGTNFSTTPANNTVQFNGATAVVTASTVTSISTTVPLGATTGSITVAVAGNTATSGTNFTVTASPIIAITIQPSDYTACVGQTATFTAAASGTTNITYQWQYSPNGIVPFVDIINGGGYSNSNTSVLSINTAGTFGEGRYRCRINGDFAAEVLSFDEGLFINPIPFTPTSSDVTNCGSGSVILTVAGGANGQYRWYTSATGATPISGETSSSYTTPSISATTTYFVSINDGTCESIRAPVVATINTPPLAPTVAGVTGCSPASVTLTASGGTSGQYRWYSVATGGTAIVGETSGSYTTASLTSTVTYYASIDNGTCESTRTAVIATINSCTTNQPPVIQTRSLATQIDGEVTLSLLSLISDPDNNIDLTKLTIVSQPKSGAVASIDASQNLIIDYKNIAFAGLDELTIEVCDLAGSCVQQKISIDVAGDIIVYNGISPNGDDQNPIFRIKYIDLIDATKNNRVSIYNRWGSKVFEVENYNNTTNVFHGLNNNGNELPSGTYFYKIEFSSGRKIESGYLSLKR